MSLLDLAKQGRDTVNDWNQRDPNRGDTVEIGDAMAGYLFELSKRLLEPSDRQREELILDLHGRISCAWCEEADPNWDGSDGHDEECPFAPAE